VENRLTSVTKTGVGTTTFSYDASGQRVKMQKPDGTIVYTPFPTYEAEVSEAEGTTIIRSTYSLADQMMAVRVSGDRSVGTTACSTTTPTTLRQAQGRLWAAPTS
jgi:YD repeat-containing protein